jgi:hypothetical protein
MNLLNSTYFGRELDRAAGIEFLVARLKVLFGFSELKAEM